MVTKTATKITHTWADTVQQFCELAGCKYFVNGDTVILCYDKEPLEIINHTFSPYLGYGSGFVKIVEKGKVNFQNPLSYFMKYYKGEAKRSVMPHAGNTHMYIYSPLVKNQYVHDVSAPLLRKTEYESKGSTRVTKIFRNLYYLNLRNLSFDHIHVYIANESGQELSLRSEAFSCTLHFRRVK